MGKIGGLGIDIETIGRFVERPYPRYTSFYQKLFTSAEIDYCLNKKNPYPHFTVRFCAKEALIKALAGEQTPPYREMEVVYDGAKPFVVWRGNRYTVSLSHDITQAVAVVIL